MRQFSLGGMNALRTKPAVGEYYPQVRRFVARLAGEAHADDLTQEVFVRVVRALDEYEDRGNIKGWIFTIAARVCIDHRKKLKAVPLAEAAVAARDEMPRHERRELEEAILAAVRQLPPEQRQVFWMRQAEEIPFREIAARLGVPLGTVLARMKYAMDAIREKVRTHAV